MDRVSMVTYLSFGSCGVFKLPMFCVGCFWCVSCFGGYGFWGEDFIVILNGFSWLPSTILYSRFSISVLRSSSTVIVCSVSLAP